MEFEDFKQMVIKWAESKKACASGIDDFDATENWDEAAVVISEYVDYLLLHPKMFNKIINILSTKVTPSDKIKRGDKFYSQESLNTGGIYYDEILLATESIVICKYYFGNRQGKKDGVSHIGMSIKEYFNYPTQKINSFREKCRL